MKRELLTPAQAAERAGITAEELELYRIGGTGPDYIAVTSRTIRYLPEDIDRWIASNEKP